MDAISTALKSIFLKALEICLEFMFTTVDQHITGIAGDLSITPMAWLGGLPWNFVSAISENVIVPLAGLILAFVLTTELIKIVTDKRSVNEIDPFELIVFTAKLGVLSIVTANCQNIVGGIFQLGGELVEKALGVIDITPTGGADIATEIVGTLNDNGFSFMSILIIILIATLIMILNYGVIIATTLIIYGRIIEIILYCAVAPIPMATYFNPKWDVATNYIKTLFSLMLQGLFIILVLGIYIIITSVTATHDLGNMGGILTAMFSHLGWSVLLAGMLMKTGTVAKSIMNAH